MTNTTETTFTLELDLHGATELSKSISKTLAAEKSKMERHGKGHPIAQSAARTWRILDDVMAQLHSQMGDLVADFES